MQRCSRCQGSKKIAPMGGIYVQCTLCHGIGSITDERANEIERANFIAVKDELLVKVTCEHIGSQPFNGAIIIDEPTEFDISGVHLLNETMPRNIGQEILEGVKEIVKNKPGRKKGWNKPATSINL